MRLRSVFLFLWGCCFGVEQVNANKCAMWCSMQRASKPVENGPVAWRCALKASNGRCPGSRTASDWFACLCGCGYWCLYWGFVLSTFVHWSWLLMIRSKARIWSRSSKSLAQYAAAVSKPSSWMRSRMSNGNKSGSICQLYASRARKAKRWNTSASSMLTAKWSTCAPAVTKTNWQLPFHEHSCCKRMPKRNGDV